MDRQVRKGLNESWFREVNERLEQRATAEETDKVFSILCECEREDCAERIVIPLNAYEQVRADPRAFIMLAAHVDAETDEVLSTHDGYVVVQKVGKAGLVAEIENPRRSE